MKGQEKNTGMFVFFVVIGAIIGNLFGNVLGMYIPELEFLRKAYYFGVTNPIVMDLKFMDFTFGLGFNISFMTIVGIIVAMIIYRNY